MRFLRKKSDWFLEQFGCLVYGASVWLFIAARFRMGSIQIFYNPHAL